MLQDKPWIRVHYHRASFRSAESARTYQLRSDENLHPVGRRFLLVPSYRGSSPPSLMRNLSVFYNNTGEGKRDSWAVETSVFSPTMPSPRHRIRHNLNRNGGRAAHKHYQEYQPRSSQLELEAYVCMNCARAE
ncbi:MAG: hypothetical protein MASP_01598 [Candidatus Methanolliviera sp. GoM_asphalt]|nr:MAG: hypothetical protein MASP_01598 [Candidatus Methanolliviera sp. GoM_asphalt]